MDENFAYWSASFQRAGKWFSSSLALGTNVVANITDRLSSDLPCYHNRANVSTLSAFNPHGGPITHSSTGSKPDSPVHPRFPELCLTRGLIYNSRATSREIINSGIRHNTFSHCSETLSHSGSDFEQLSIHLEPLIVPSYLTLDVFDMFNSRDNLMLIHGLTPRLFPS